MSEHKRGKGIYSFLRKQTFRHLTSYYALLYRKQNTYIPKLFFAKLQSQKGYHSSDNVNNGIVNDQLTSFPGR